MKEGTKRRFYLEEARGHAKRWEAFRRRTQPSQRVGTAKFAQANAEKLPQADESFDVVVNVYLFHELPHEARCAAAREMARSVGSRASAAYSSSISSSRTGTSSPAAANHLPTPSRSRINSSTSSHARVTVTNASLPERSARAVSDVINAASSSNSARSTPSS